MTGFVGRAGGLQRSARNCDGRQHCSSRTPLGGRRKKGQKNQAIGRSRGGPTTKIHALADGAGRLYAIMLTADRLHDVHGGRALLASVLPMRRPFADKACDANNLRKFLAIQGTEPVISPMPRQLMKPAFDATAYSERDLIERAFCQLENWHAVATRYDETTRNFLTGICLNIAVTHWLE